MRWRCHFWKMKREGPPTKLLRKFFRKTELVKILVIGAGFKFEQRYQSVKLKVSSFWNSIKYLLHQPPPDEYFTILFLIGIVAQAQLQLCTFSFLIFFFSGKCDGYKFFFLNNFSSDAIGQLVLRYCSINPSFICVQVA